MPVLLNFMGKADGESQMKGHEKWVEVQSWSWAVEAQTSWTKGGGASVGKPDPGALTFTHRYDSASPALLGHLVSGKSFDRAQLVVLSGSPPQADPSFTMTLEGVFLTGVRTSCDGDVIFQQVDVVFKKVTIDYRALDNRSGALSAPKTVTWDVVAGTSTSPVN